MPDNKAIRRSLVGKNARAKGKAAERYFEFFCRGGSGFMCSRIEDAVKHRGSFVGRAKQLGDYHLFYRGMAAIADVKTSKSLNPNTISQIPKWREIRDRTGFDKFVLIYVWEDKNAKSTIYPVWLQEFDDKVDRSLLVPITSPKQIFMCMPKSKKNP